ncbi:MAG TPA: hypothetical protein VIK14_16960 [Ignavibacteria bacterium]
MGSLIDHNVLELKEKYNLQHFVETGTYQGHGIYSMMNLNFLTYHSIEIIEEYALQCQEIFKEYAQVKIYHGNSIDKLPGVLKSIPIEERILFWLDAHFYSEYSNNVNSVFKLTGQNDFPLWDEVQVILLNRNTIHDVFIIDDLRIYLYGEYGSGPCPNGQKSSLNNINFLYKSFFNTHSIYLSSLKEGTVYIVPRSL